MTLTTNLNSQKGKQPHPKNNHQKNTQRSGKPTEHPAASLEEPNTGKLTCDTKRLTETFSHTLLTLGGPLNYEPSAHTAEELLQHTPQCPPTAAIGQRTELAQISQNRPKMIAAAREIATAVVSAMLRQPSFGIWRHRKIIYMHPYAGYLLAQFHLLPALLQTFKGGWPRLHEWLPLPHLS